MLLSCFQNNQLVSIQRVVYNPSVADHAGVRIPPEESALRPNQVTKIHINPHFRRNVQVSSEGKIVLLSSISQYYSMLPRFHSSVVHVFKDYASFLGRPHWETEVSHQGIDPCSSNISSGTEFHHQSGLQFQVSFCLEKEPVSTLVTFSLSDTHTHTHICN